MIDVLTMALCDPILWRFFGLDGSELAGVGRGKSEKVVLWRHNSSLTSHKYREEEEEGKKSQWQNGDFLRFCAFEMQWS